MPQSVSLSSKFKKICGRAQCHMNLSNDTLVIVILGLNLSELAAKRL